MKTVYAIAVLALLCSPALAQEDKIKLKNGPGKDKVEENCGACHSLDYIQMNSPFLDGPKWEATVKKMAGPLGAPIDAKDMPAIIEYLTKNYGG